jgi:D-glycero-alpha-D-manno-heptose 1-phosphate guanylyltransferase
MSEAKIDVTALLLAGGKGSRLKGVAPGTQKVIARINGRPFISNILEQISAIGISDAHLCVGYQASSVRAELGDRYHAVNLHYSIEEEPLGTGGALRLALPSVSTSHVLVFNGDSYLDINLEPFLAWFLDGQIEAGLLLTKVENISRFGQVSWDEYHRVLAFREKGGSSGEGWINAGIYLFTTALLQEIPQHVAFSLEEELLAGLVRERKLHAYPVHAAFIDIGTPESFREAETFLKGLKRNE